MINKNPRLFKFRAEPVEPWITIKSTKAAIWSRGKRNNLAASFFCPARSRNRERRPSCLASQRRFLGNEQVGPRERSAKGKTGGKQLKSVKNFIARTQAKVDAKLTQSRLLSTLSPAKRENDPFHPSLDLSPSREEGTSSNVI